jgi:hypothetical protein
MLRPPRLLFGSLVACVPVLGLVAAISPAAGASTAPASQSARAAAIARTAIEHLVIGQHSADQRVPGPARQTQGLSQVQSDNWSGYVDTTDTYGTITGSWTEPSVSCGLLTSLAAFWVGIDGDSSDSVEQDGTLAECYLGTAYYYTWWEMYPTNDVQTVGGAVQPGDSISASVVRSGTSYTLQVTDSSHPANSFSTTQTCSDCANSSAEWIAEAPSGTFGVEPLAKFGTWTLTGATVTSGVTSGVISTFPDDAITMTDTLGLTKAAPGPLNSGGNGFTVTWERSS